MMNDSKVKKRRAPNTEGWQINGKAVQKTLAAAMKKKRMQLFEQCL
jgi:hypothetical protein